MPRTPTIGDGNRSPSPFIQKMGADERRAHMQRIGAIGNSRRITLSGEEKAALSEAYRLIRRIADRHGLTESEARDAT